jgi:hypothetical protein
MKVNKSPKKTRKRGKRKIQLKNQRIVPIFKAQREQKRN